MVIDAGDPGCLAALAVEIGHPPPFGDHEAAAVTTLAITHTRDLSLIRKCSGLRHLRIVASELRDLRELEALTELTHLEVFCSRFKALGGASFCDHLVRFDVLFTSVEDASAVLGSPRSRGA